MSKKQGKVFRTPKQSRGDKSRMETWEKQQAASDPRKLTPQESRRHPGYDGKPDPH